MVQMDLMIPVESVLVQHVGVQRIKNVAVDRAVVLINVQNMVNGQYLQKIVYRVFKIANGFLMTVLAIIKLFKTQVYL